ncbi:MAG: hypothetical protein HZA53_04955 [Planctomycetes bacterium]|nr:hypothetical protein [Planctomycetota bacterium]
MLDTPQVVPSLVPHAAVLRFTIAKHAVQEVMGPAIGAVLAAVAAEERQPAGPVVSHLPCLYPEGWDVEVGVPVASAP